MSSIRYTCNGPRLYRVDGELREIRDGLPDAACAEYLGHKGCGKDLTAAIAAVPADGATHRATCPRCKTVAEIMKTPAAESQEG